MAAPPVQGALGHPTSHHVAAAQKPQQARRRGAKRGESRDRFWQISGKRAASNPSPDWDRAIMSRFPPAQRVAHSAVLAGQVGWVVRLIPSCRAEWDEGE
jgi:hypothetical protein